MTKLNWEIRVIAGDYFFVGGKKWDQQQQLPQRFVRATPAVVVTYWSEGKCLRKTEKEWCLFCLSGLSESKTIQTEEVLRPSSQPQCVP